MWIFFAILTVSSLFSFERQVKFCLFMVIQNEDKKIYECLRSIEGIADAVCAVELKPSRWTSGVVEEFIDKYNLPGGVFLYENRGLDVQAFGLEIGRKILDEAHFSLQDTYFLLLDSDMVLETRPDFRKNRLTQDSYLMLQKSFSLGYSTYDVRLLKASLPWKYTPLMNEPWICSEASPSVRLYNVMIEGGTSCFDREASIIAKSLNQNPKSDKHLFSLAQYYKSQKEYEIALPIYMERIEKEGDFEEFWLSHYMIGSCYQALNEWDKALYWYLEAFRIGPNRSEPIHKIACHYRSRGQNHLAYLFAKHGSQVARPPDQKLFDYPPLSGYEFDEEISIAAYYTQFKQDGFRAASDLLIRKYVPDWIWAQNGRNIFFYSVFLKNAKFQPINLNLPLVDLQFEERYHPISASIIKTKNGYKLVCSVVNYTQKGAKIFHTIEADGIFRTKNFFAYLDQSFRILSQQQVLEELPRQRFPACNLEGLQDSRLFEWEGSDWLAATTIDTNPTGSRQVSLCQLSEGCSLPSIQVERLIPLNGPDMYRQEKNWLPFIYKNQLQLVYSCAPFTLYTPSLEKGGSIVEIGVQSSFDFSHFRGSAAPISFDDGYLMLIHEVVVYPDCSRSYLHRFLFLNGALEVEKISDSFAFLHEGIERCNGMTIDHSGENLILPVGVEDREIYLCSVSVENVRSLLHPLHLLETNRNCQK